MISQQYDTPLYKLPWWEKAQSEKLEAAKAKREARKLTRRPCPASLLPADLVKASSSCASAVATPAVADVEAPAVDAVALGGFEQHTVAVVPEGISPGKIFEVHDATSQMTFPTSCPPDAAPGDEILVTLPNFSLDFCTVVPNDHESDFRALVERVGEEMLMADFEALSVETVSMAAHTTSTAPSSGLQSHPGAPAIIPVTRRNRTTSSSESGTTACLRGTERSVR